MISKTAILFPEIDEYIYRIQDKYMELANKGMSEMLTAQDKFNKDVGGFWGRAGLEQGYSKEDLIKIADARFSPEETPILFRHGIMNAIA